MGKAVITLMFISVLFISTFHATPNDDQALCGITPFGGCDPGYSCCLSIPTSNLGFCAVLCPGDVLCAVDGDCETYGDFLKCCGSGGSISSTRFCWDKRLRCPSADDVLCAVDGGCETYGDFLRCCGSGGS
eukprot:573066_1